VVASITYGTPQTGKKAGQKVWIGEVRGQMMVTAEFTCDGNTVADADVDAKKYKIWQNVAWSIWSIDPDLGGPKVHHNSGIVYDYGRDDNGNLIIDPSSSFMPYLLERRKSKSGCQTTFEYKLVGVDYPGQEVFSANILWLYSVGTAHLVDCLSDQPVPKDPQFSGDFCLIRQPWDLKFGIDGPGYDQNQTKPYLHITVPI
jgi:hypothetical protein